MREVFLLTKVRLGKQNKGEQLRSKSKTNTEIYIIFTVVYTHGFSSPRRTAYLNPKREVVIKEDISFLVLGSYILNIWVKVKSSDNKLT